MTDHSNRYSTRYVTPQPRCAHGVYTLCRRVESGDPHTGPHASVLVCAREECIEDAKAWAYANTHIEPTVISFPKRQRPPRKHVPKHKPKPPDPDDCPHCGHSLAKVHNPTSTGYSCFTCESPGHCPGPPDPLKDDNA